MTVTELDKQRILEVHKKTLEATRLGKGPFFASVYDENGNIVAEAANSVVEDNCPVYHAEVNAIRATCATLKTYDLAPYNLSLYVNAEPCIMCVGAIMWSGIKHVYYGVPSKRVEEITGFDEGFKQNWHEEFANRGITVEGNIEVAEGEKVLESYVNSGKEVYMPSR
ncbi:MAG: nucleoside deaminase [Candidatus Gastranaerophilaceae bacterium]